MRPNRRLWFVLFTAILIPSLACGGALMEGFNEGVNESAKELIEESRTTVARCDPGPVRDALEEALNRLETGMADGSFTGMGASVASGMISGATEDGCQAEDVELIQSTYPSLVP
ncbi:MAG: hypothetical protein AAFV53_23090 [Myxococcota bacterium]